jgi:hypothetical protein
MFRDQAFQAEQAGVPEKIRTDLALLELAHENAVDATHQDPRQSCCLTFA